MSTASMTIRTKESCRFDLVSLGEVMLRLDPGDGRVATTRASRPGRAAANTTSRAACKRCFGLRHRGRHRLRRQPGRAPGRRTSSTRAASTRRYVKWVKYDGVGRTRPQRPELHRARLRRARRASAAPTAATPPPRSSSRATSTGIRSSARTACAGSTPAASSRRCPRPRRWWPRRPWRRPSKHGTIVSYDLNYRDSLWKGIGGQKKAQEVNRELAKYVDVMIGNEEDFTACLGLHVEGIDDSFSPLDPANFKKMIETGAPAVPELQGRGDHPAQRQDRHASTTGARSARSATNSSSSSMRENLEIYDRVGGGDSFASGLIYGFLSGQGPAVGRRLRRRPRRAGHDHARRHQHGDPGRGPEGDEGRRRARLPLVTPAIDPTPDEPNHHGKIPGSRPHPRRRADPRRAHADRRGRARDGGNVAGGGADQPRNHADHPERHRGHPQLEPALRRQAADRRRHGARCAQLPRPASPPARASSSAPGWIWRPSPSAARRAWPSSPAR